MTIFEMVFNLIGLVLGLALVEVLGGLARTIKARRRGTIRWLTPLLGAWVVLDVAAFWGLAWEVRGLLTSLWPSLLVGVVLTSVYYLAAALIFPNDRRRHPDLDAHYWATKRPVIGLILFCNAMVLALVQNLGRIASPEVMAVNALYFSTMVATFFAPGRYVNIVLLLALIGIMTAGFLIP
ncbi:MAG TPA: hypothetical protein VNI79_04430 [Sphingomicrobium sp.]|nr:hypothetical protein [Sphingomicrobium sp.]